MPNCNVYFILRSYLCRLSWIHDGEYVYRYHLLLHVEMSFWSGVNIPQKRHKINLQIKKKKRFTSLLELIKAVSILSSA